MEVWSLNWIAGNLSFPSSPRPLTACIKLQGSALVWYYDQTHFSKRFRDEADGWSRHCGYFASASCFISFLVSSQRCVLVLDSCF